VAKVRWLLAMFSNMFWID